MDSLIGRRGYGRPLLGPLRFKSGTIGQSPRLGLSPRHFCVVGCGRGCGSFYSFHLCQCCSELSLRQISGKDRLLQRRVGNIVLPRYGVDLVLDLNRSRRK